MMSARMERGRSIALQQHQDGWCIVGGELMEVMDGKCGDIAGKKHCSNIKMVGVLLEVSCWR